MIVSVAAVGARDPAGHRRVDERDAVLREPRRRARGCRAGSTSSCRRRPRRRRARRRCRPPIRSVAAATARPSGSIVTTTSAPAKSAGRVRRATAELADEAVRRAPRSRSWTTTSMPACARLRAIGQPMLPRPTKPTAAPVSLPAPTESYTITYPVQMRGGAVSERVYFVFSSPPEEISREAFGAGTSSTSATSSRSRGSTPHAGSTSPRSTATARRRSTRTCRSTSSRATRTRRSRGSPTPPRTDRCRSPTGSSRVRWASFHGHPLEGPIDLDRLDHTYVVFSRRRPRWRSTTTSSGTRRTPARTSRPTASTRSGATGSRRTRSTRSRRASPSTPRSTRSTESCPSCARRSRRRPTPAASASPIGSATSSSRRWTPAAPRPAR